MEYEYEFFGCQIQIGRLYAYETSTYCTISSMDVDNIRVSAMNKIQTLTHIVCFTVNIKERQKLSYYLPFILLLFNFCHLDCKYLVSFSPFIWHQDESTNSYSYT